MKTESAPPPRGELWTGYWCCITESRYFRAYRMCFSEFERDPPRDRYFFSKVNVQRVESSALARARVVSASGLSPPCTIAERSFLSRRSCVGAWCVDQQAGFVSTLQTLNPKGTPSFFSQQKRQRIFYFRDAKRSKLKHTKTRIQHARTHEKNATLHFHLSFFRAV